ncbi:ABC transporter ATP-binding protein, partial [candidate division KSB1 bacterium]|nr:ABC transporter ATP-binding protein [candidate division KSB1 bacterium]
GPNGAGKTTLVKLLLGILLPTHGDARILDTPIKNHRIHSRIGYLAENHRFPPFLTAHQVMWYYGKMSGVKPAVLNERIPQLLKTVKMEKWGRVKIKKYSKGMMQRVGLAHALLNDPDIVFLDEPTDGIDPVGRREIRDVLQQLRQRGKTIFLNSHLLSEVERISDEIAILKEGRVLQSGSVNEFISVEHQYQLSVEDTDKVLVNLCRTKNITQISKKDYFQIGVKDENQLNDLIDSLRQKKVIIKAIIPHKISLEDFFIQIVNDQKEPEK